MFCGSSKFLKVVLEGIFVLYRRSVILMLGILYVVLLWNKVRFIICRILGIRMIRNIDFENIRNFIVK